MLYKFILTVLKFLVSRLEANAQAFERDADSTKQTIDTLIQKRMASMEAAGKVSGLANNLNKLVS